MKRINPLLDINKCKYNSIPFKKINTDFNQTFIITTHNPQVAAIGSRKLKMVNGRLRINK